MKVVTVPCGHCGRLESFEHIVACRRRCACRQGQLCSRSRDVTVESLLEKLYQWSDLDRVSLHVCFTGVVPNIAVSDLVEGLERMMGSLGGTMGGIEIGWDESDSSTRKLLR